MKIAIIGAGNLGKAIANGLLEAGIVKAGELALTKRNINSLKAYQEKGVKVTSDNAVAVQEAELVFLCVQPHKLAIVLEDLKGQLLGKLVISTITGVSLQRLIGALDSTAVVFRAMPNTAIAIKESMTCIATNTASGEEKALVETVFSHLGTSLYIEDELMGAATVLAASGIAFAMRYVRASMQAGIEIGFESDEAQMIAAQTIKGATSLLLANASHPESEIDKVTTPLGITITGLNKMEQAGFSAALTKGIQASYEKIKRV